MGVDVDETGAHDEPVRVDRPAPAVGHGADRDDASTVDRDVGSLARGTGAVDDLTPADDDVVHDSSWTSGAASLRGAAERVNGAMIARSSAGPVYVGPPSARVLTRFVAHANAAYAVMPYRSSRKQRMALPRASRYASSALSPASVTIFSKTAFEFGQVESPCG